MNSRRQSTNGFTLLELLVATSVFSVIGLGAHQMLRTVIESHDRVRDSTESYTKLNLAYAVIQRDFNQFAARRIRDEYGEPLNPITFESDDYAVEFTRAGWTNPAGIQRSRLQRVAYSVDYDTKELRRHFWIVLDRAEDSEPKMQVLLENVSDFRVTGFVGEESDEATEDLFSSGPDASAAPVAVEVTIGTEAFGDVVRLFQLVDPFVQQNLGRPANSPPPLDEIETDRAGGTSG